MTAGLAALGQSVDISKLDGDTRLARVVQHYIAVANSLVNASEVSRELSDHWPLITRELSQPGAVHMDPAVDGGLKIGGYTFRVNQETKLIEVHDYHFGEGEPLFTLSSAGQIARNYQNPSDVNYSEDPVRMVFREIGKLYTPETLRQAFEWEPKA